MALLPIITAPDARLKVVSTPVETVDDGVRRLMDDMLTTMYDEPGIGLSAVQVGVPRRIVVVDVAREGEEPAPYRMVNPEIVWRSSARSAAAIDSSTRSAPFCSTPRDGSARRAFRAMERASHSCTIHLRATTADRSASPI